MFNFSSICGSSIWYIHKIIQNLTSPFPLVSECMYLKKKDCKSENISFCRILQFNLNIAASVINIPKFNYFEDFFVANTCQN